MLNERVKLAIRAIVLTGCFSFAFPCALAAAIPTAAECKAARVKLAELTEDDYKALKAKSKTNEQVGDALLGYAGNEETAVGKFALLQDAFQQYVLGKSVDKADSTYSKALAVGGVEYALEMARPARTKLSAYATSKNAPAKALKERIAADEKSFQRVGIVKAKLKKAPGDESLCEQLGIEYAAIGDWESALAAFVTAAGEVAKVADWELNGGKGSDYTAATAGAFWWKFADNFQKRKNVEEAMKLHAAMWYKLALDKDAFKGNEKAIIEKRIAETEKFGAAEQQEKEIAAKKMATLDPIKLEFSKDNVVELIGCPAGEFMMGKKGDDDKNSPTRYHKVKITRPFWMSKYKVTHGIWKNYQKIELTNEDNILGGWMRVHMDDPLKIEEFLQWLNRRSFRLCMPKGYVFRLPTEAEWEYVLRANVCEETDPYYQILCGNNEGVFVICSEAGDARLKDRDGILPRFDYEIRGVAVGAKKANNWGFYDLIGNGGSLTMDVLLDGKFNYSDVEIDPLRWMNGIIWSRRGGVETNQIWYYRKNGSPYLKLKVTSAPIAFFIVLGPDLMKEKGYDKKAQKKR